MAAQQPIHTIAIGRVEAAVWENRSSAGNLWYTVTLSRSYRDGEHTKSTASFRLEDLPLVQKASDMAFAWIWRQIRDQQVAANVA